MIEFLLEKSITNIYYTDKKSIQLHDSIVMALP